jgi:hypothetical protein
MKILLVVLFIVMFIYLIIHMCSESDDSRAPTRSDKGFDKSLLVLNGLQALDDKDLSRLRNDLQDLKALLGKNRVEGGVETLRADRRNSKVKHGRSGKAILKNIRKDLNRLGGYHHRGNAFSKFRVVLVQIALILITILMILL